MKKRSTSVREKREEKRKLRLEKRSKEDYNPLTDEERVQGKEWRRKAKEAEWETKDDYGFTSSHEAKSFSGCSCLSTELILFNEEHKVITNLKIEIERLNLIIARLNKGEDCDHTHYENDIEKLKLIIEELRNRKQGKCENPHHDIIRKLQKKINKMTDMLTHRDKEIEKLKVELDTERLRPRDNSDTEKLRSIEQICFNQ